MSASEDIREAGAELDNRDAALRALDGVVAASLLASDSTTVQI